MSRKVSRRVRTASQMSRIMARETAFKALFQLDFNFAAENEDAAAYEDLAIETMIEDARFLTGDNASRKLTTDNATQELTTDDATQELTTDDATQELTTVDATQELTTDDAPQELTTDDATQELTTVDATQELTTDDATRKLTGNDDPRKLTGDDLLYVEATVKGTRAHLKEIDEIISAHLKQGWQLSRIMATDRNILRLAVYEMRFAEPPLSKNIAINEAVELAKAYGTDDSGRFVNGILEAISK